jgi:hypothetical protein
MCFVQLLVQTATVYLNINRPAFLMDTKCVLCEVGPECYIAINFRVNTANSLMAITKKFSVDNWSDPNNHHCQIQPAHSKGNTEMLRY